MARAWTLCRMVLGDLMGHAYSRYPASDTGTIR